MTIKMKVANTGFHFCRKNYKGYNETRTSLLLGDAMFYRMIVVPAILAVAFPVMLNNFERYLDLSQQIKQAKEDRKYVENFVARYTNGVDW